MKNRNITQKLEMKGRKQIQKEGIKEGINEREKSDSFTGNESKKRD